MSMIKSLTSTLIGVALQQGAIGSLDDAVSKYIPALRGCAYDAVTHSPPDHDVLRRALE
jgi:CubicO group peptidase (beta-lactamase class C family)